MTNESPDTIWTTMAGAVDLRKLDRTAVLTPLEEMALRKNMVVARRGVVAEPDKLVPIGIYARYSSGKQKQKSIDRQVSIVAAYMLSLGYAIYVLYSDPARSARSMHREALQRLLADCRAGKIKIIMVEDFDRWSRETFDAVQLCEELNELGVEFHSAGDLKALSKKEAIEAALKAEGDRDRRNLIMSMGRVQHAAAGGAHSGEFFGYRYGPERGFLIPYKPEAKVIEAVFEMAAAGVSFRKIGQILKARRAPGPTAGCKWTHATVANILGQIAYTGRWYFPFTKNVYNRKTNKTKKYLRHPSEMTREHFETLRIVSDELFFKVNARRRTLDSGPHGHPHFLEGKVTCDCAGVGRQRFNVSAKQLVCGRHALIETCPGRSHSVMTVPVERAVMAAIGDRIRSVVGNEEFAVAVDRSLGSAAAGRRSARAEVERTIAGLSAKIMRLLDEDLEGGYPIDIRAEKARTLEAERVAARAKLADLPELPEVLGAEDRIRALADAVSGLTLGRRPFRAKTAGETLVSNALARLVERVEVVRTGLPTGVMRLRIALNFAAFLHEDDEARPASPEAEIVEVEVVQFMGRHARFAQAAAEIRGRGLDRIDDARWAAVADLLPDVTSSHPGARHFSTRDVVDALLLRLRTGMPILSTAAGDPYVMTRALHRFVYAMGDRILLDALGAKDPDFVAGLDLRRLQAFRKTYKLEIEDWRKCRGSAARLMAVGERPALDDAQWAVCRPLLHPNVEAPLKRSSPSLPSRLIVEATILALRTGRPWHKLPERFGDGRIVKNAIRRLVTGGSWDRLVELWTVHFPDLVDSLNLARLAKLRRGSAQWRGPSPKRSLYARNGGVAPLEGRPSPAENRRARRLAKAG